MKGLLSPIDAQIIPDTLLSKPSHTMWSPAFFSPQCGWYMPQLPVVSSAPPSDRRPVVGKRRHKCTKCAQSGRAQTTNAPKGSTEKRLRERHRTEIKTRTKRECSCQVSAPLLLGLGL